MPPVSSIPRVQTPPVGSLHYVQTPPVGSLPRVHSFSGSLTDSGVMKRKMKLAKIGQYLGFIYVSFNIMHFFLKNPKMYPIIISVNC